MLSIDFYDKDDDDDRNEMGKKVREMSHDKSIETAGSRSCYRYDEVLRRRKVAAVERGLYIFH